MFKDKIRLSIFLDALSVRVIKGQAVEKGLSVSEYILQLVNRSIIKRDKKEKTV